MNRKPDFSGFDPGYAECPFSGLAILSKPEWTHIDLGDDYSVTFKIIGERILISSSKGRATGKSMERLFVEKAKVLNAVLEPHEMYFELRDYSGIQTPPKSARDCFRRGMEADRERIIGFIGFEAPTAVRLAMNVGKKLFHSPFPIVIVKDYQSAIQRALEYLSDWQAPASPPQTEKTLPQDCILNLEGFSCRCEILNQNILHAFYKGHMEAAHTTQLFDLHERILHAAGICRQPYAFLVDLTELKGADRQARRLYFRWLKAWYQQNPFQLFAIYGANRLLNSAINVYKSFTHFPITNEKTFQAALGRINKIFQPQPLAHAVTPSSTEATGSFSGFEREMDDLLQFVGSINWTIDGFSDTVKRVEENHPFSPIYDAIELIKKDVDELFRERDHAAKALEEAKIAAEQANRELLKVNQELEEAIEKAREMANQAQTANIAKNHFLANISHEIRTPMNGVIGFTQLLRETNLDSVQTDYLDTIYLSGMALLTLLNDILDFSKIESRGMKLESIEFDPELLIYDVCELSRPRLLSKPVAVKCRMADQVPAKVLGDPGRFRRVLVNLMSNAAKFTLQGEIELALEVAEETPERIRLLASVRDTGIGIPADKLAQVFEPFQQVDGSMTRKFGGTGLGLSICKQIADLMQGDIRLESRVGVGSTFFFSVWFDKVAQAPSNRLAAISLAQRKVLIIDSVPSNRQILELMLGSAGMEIRVAAGGRETLAMLAAGPSTKFFPDICLCDIQLPDMSGYEVCRTIRNTPGPYADLPMVAVSAAIDAGKCLEAGFDGFVGIPIQQEKVFQMLERIMANPSRGKTTRGSKITTRHSIREERKQGVRILLAAAPAQSKAASDLLRKGGYQVQTVDSGSKALEALMDYPKGFDMILMDLNMPVTDGYSATRIIRGNGFGRIPIVGMADPTLSTEAHAAVEAGMNAWITKPISRDQVFQVIDRFVLQTSSLPESNTAG